METILSIARIRQEAHDAAKHFDDVNAACPYPFGSEAGRVFREQFLATRAEFYPSTPLEPTS